MTNNGFLYRKGSFKNLLTYQKAIIVYDCTYAFCRRFLEKRDRTTDQMVQAARSGKQNIVEGAKAAVTSTETELKLTNVARSSLEELLEDYVDFLRVRGFALWKKDGKKASYVRKLGAGKIAPPKIDGPNRKDEPNAMIEPEAPNTHLNNSNALQEDIRRAFVHFMQTRPPGTCANIMVCLINQCNYLLDLQIEKLEEDFTKQGGLRERMYNARVNYRRNCDRRSDFENISRKTERFDKPEHVPNDN